MNRNLAALGVFVSLSAGFAQQAGDLAQARIAAAFSRLPMSFEPNGGQTDSQVNYLARGSGYALLLTPSGGIMSLRAAGKPSGS